MFGRGTLPVWRRVWSARFSGVCVGLFAARRLMAAFLETVWFDGMFGAAGGEVSAKLVCRAWVCCGAVNLAMMAMLCASAGIWIHAGRDRDSLYVGGGLIISAVRRVLCLCVSVLVRGLIVCGFSVWHNQVESRVFICLYALILVPLTSS